MFAIIKKVIVFILLSVFLLQMYSKLILYTEYIINKDYIAKVLCINQDKPKIGCEGKCALKKQVKEVEEKEQKGATSSNTDKVEVLFSQSFKTDDIVLHIETKESASERSFINSFYSFDIVIDIFHPPQNFII